MRTKTPHLTDDQLAALALGEASPETAVHLQLCDACRAEASVYRSILRSTREVFCDELMPVDVMSCDHTAAGSDLICEAIHPAQRLHISLARINGLLVGQVSTAEQARDSWHDVPVRLFDAQGLVASGQLSPSGDFALAAPDPNRRYSLGLVLTRQSVPELMIVGQISRY